jgi:putative endonuclease
MAYVYMLQCADGTYYTGWTFDLQGRLKQHNAGRASRYTRGRLPVSFAYWERVPSKSHALRREAALRRLPRAAKRALAAEFSASGPRSNKEVYVA